jgi:glycosyltransferase involved in cell wall biosynthesis
MRVVILSQWYRPEPEMKVHLLARDLAARGHEVTAITGIPNYPIGRVYDGYRLRPWPQVEQMDGVRVVRVPLFPDRSRLAFKRAANYASFALSAAAFGPWMSGPADVMWVHHPPLTVALPAMAISKLRRIPIVYEIQDLWPETLAATGMVRSSRALAAVGWGAKQMYRWADRITVISPGFRANLIGKGVPEEKIEVMPNWADEDVYRPVPPSPDLAARLGLSGRFNILYAGNMGPAQDLDNVLNAAAMLRDLPDLQFVLVGEGVDRDRLRERARREVLQNVLFLERIPAEEISGLAAISEAMLVHLGTDRLFEITIPSKTLSALACGRPILTVSRGDPANVVVDSGAGVACPPGNSGALAAAVRDLHAMAPGRRAVMAQAARTHFLANFTRARLVPRYERLLESLASAEGGKRRDA